MSKSLTEFEHYANNGAVIKDQWYQHSISGAAKSVEEVPTGTLHIFIYNKSNRPLTMPLEIGLTVGSILWSGFYRTENDNYSVVGTHIGFHNNAPIMANFIININGTSHEVYFTSSSVTDTVTPY